MKYVKLFEMFFTDLSSYSDSEDLRFKKAFESWVRIGWLDSKHNFSKGDVDQEIIDKLKQLEPYVRTKGWHSCEFCKTEEDRWAARSSTEFKITGKNGITYAFPQMLLHYITKHNYKPPQEFLDAVMETEIEEKERPARRYSSGNPGFRTKIHPRDRRK